MSNRKDRTEAWVYPTATQKAQWKADADYRGWTMSEYIKNMVEAGRKKFTAEFQVDEDAHVLRQERNELQDDLDELRRRIDTLDQLLERTDASTVRRFIRNHPDGVTFDSITQYVEETTPRRVNAHLEELEGTWVEHDPETDRYYLADTNLSEPDRETRRGGR